MLKKLIKSEWKDTWAVGTVCSIIVVGMSIIGMILFSLDIWKGRSRMNEVMEGFTATMIAFYFMMLVFGIIGVVFVVRYFFFYRYYKNLFTDHGYLMNTLPVKSTDLIFSKLIVGVIWQFLIWIVVVVSIMGMIFAMVVNVGEIRISDFWDAMKEFFEALRWVFRDEDFMQVSPFFICSMLATILWPIAELLLMYAAVGIGQLSKKRKFLVAVFILIGFNMIKSLVVNLISIPLTLVSENLPSEFTMNVFAVIWLVITIGMIIGLFFANKYFLEKKLNLE